MKMKTIRPSAAMVWASLFLTILPLAYLAVLELAWRKGAMEQAQSDRWVPCFRVLGAPGLLLSRLFGYEPLFWVEHATGRAFWETLTVFLVANLAGWVVLMAGVAFAVRRLQARASQRG